MGRRRRGVMSESFKTELAKDLGFYNVVQKEGWEGIRSKDAGNMVKRAIQIAEAHLAGQNQNQIQNRNQVQGTQSVTSAPYTNQNASTTSGPVMKRPYQ
jgi:small acid-soluble spore protein F (minor alpha/beta-type SASP)